jgi:photosystem II stability/assembly factor-like uncharacterized protein
MDTEATPKILFFADSKRGWFLWRKPTSAAFSSGMMLHTEDGGSSWTQLPDPPAASPFRFETATDGWMAGGAGGDDLWATTDGGATWSDRSVTAPSSCASCQPRYQVPKFSTPNEGILAVVFVEHHADKNRHLECTYATVNGGVSWRNTECFSQSPPFVNGALTSVHNTGVTRVYSDAQHGIQIRSAGAIRNVPYPTSLPAHGLIMGSKFVDGQHGWLRYQVYACNKFQDPTKELSGPPCVDGVQHNELLTTTDGGATLRTVTVPKSPQSEQ